MVVAMPPPHPLYLAWLAERVADGERRPRAPLHLTLVPPFAASTEAALDAVRAAVRERRPVPAGVGPRSRMGPGRRIPVLMVEPPGELRRLHVRLMDALAARSVDLDHLRHVRERFAPHISLRRGPEPPALAPGRPLVVDHVALLRRGDGWTEVVAREPLAGPSGGRGGITVDPPTPLAEDGGRG